MLSKDSFSSQVISEQVLTGLEANFNLDSIDEKLHASEDFGDYPSLSNLRQKAREQAAQKAPELKIVRHLQAGVPRSFIPKKGIVNFLATSIPNSCTVYNFLQIRLNFFLHT